MTSTDLKHRLAAILAADAAGYSRLMSVLARHIGLELIYAGAPKARGFYVHVHASLPVATRLYQALTDIQYGRAEDPYRWTRVVDADSGSGKAG